MACAISPDGKYVAAVDLSDKHVVFIYNLERQTLVLKQESGASEMEHMAWSKRPDDYRLAVLGTKQL